ncbi:PIN domain-containing protein [Nitratireductor sp. CAU 1489]|uniref:Ribonuclease VapC n=1 Tax=Nitratireductor arenosus TaxID=2682096 RepID=A0A844QFQ5_9HYPH|nr:type II toxin-antitoxin system VapC family toxin [Nitratireductor arenosus]MVA98115.1 PIN domain-containing protein [Nitratireductor arenosus]
MTDFVADTSALIAILTAESEAEAFMAAFDSCEAYAISAATLHEAHCVARRAGLVDGNARLDRFVELTRPNVEPFDGRQLDVARDAYLRYGRGSGHRAGLNMGDCFSYALARTHGLPLLFKGDDFVHTDIEPALTPQ